MTATGRDQLNTRRQLTVDGKEYDYFSIHAAEESIGDITRLPTTLKVLFENLLRHENGRSVTVDQLHALKSWLDTQSSDTEISYHPARILLQDLTGVPAVVDLAAMRDAMADLGGDPDKINPQSAVDLVIDHSVMVDAFGNDMAFDINVKREFERNGERYSFLKWGKNSFSNFQVVPPGTGICHQVNLELLGKAVWTSEDEQTGNSVAYPDTLVGTDSHTPMINGLGVLGWGVGGIEAEAAMLGQPISMLIPEVVGFKITGKLAEGATATDLVLTVTQMLRNHGVVSKFVEFYGPGLDHMTLADRATIGNMTPEYGATCAFFPVDDETLNYMRFTGRDDHTVNLVEHYCKEQGLWRNKDAADPVFSSTLELDLGDVVPSIAGPKRPQDRILLTEAAAEFKRMLADDLNRAPAGPQGKYMAEAGQIGPYDMVAKDELSVSVPVENADYDMDHGDVVIAAITSCTNTSNPSVMVASGLVAKKALEKGLDVKPWVKTSLAPGSKVVTEYLEKSGLQESLDALGFNLVGYGCTTCIGNSGPLPENIVTAINDGDLNVASVLSGNRNFEGRISPHVKSNYLASPPLVVAYALAGSMKADITTQSLGTDHDGNDVYLKDIWPSSQEIQDTIHEFLTPKMFNEQYADVFTGTDEWREIDTTDESLYQWEDISTYVKKPPFFDGMTMDIPAQRNLKNARPLGIFGDTITTDHISPAGAIKVDSPAGKYLIEKGIEPRDFNSYGSRRGNHEVMMRGTFANIRIKNLMVPGVEGGFTKYMPEGEQMPIYDAAMKYIDDGTDLVVIAGKEYGTGSSRDWAAKGTILLGVRVVIAESYERIHRSNLIGMGVMPAQFANGITRESLNLDGSETFDVTGLEDGLVPGKDLTLTIHRKDGTNQDVPLVARIDTEDELDYYRHGGILHYVLRQKAA